MQTERTWSEHFTWHLKQLPFQILHMRELAENTIAAQDTSAVVVSGSSEKARLPYRVDPADDADLLYATLILFGREVAEKIGGAAPRPLQSRMWRGRDEPQGLPLCTPREAQGYAAEIITWLCATAHQIAHDGTLNSAPDDLIDTIRQMRGRYPRADPKFKAYRPRPCPLCEQATIAPTYDFDGLAGFHCDTCEQQWDRAGNLTEKIPIRERDAP